MPELKPTLLLILDGCGCGPKDEGNAIYMARTPNLDRIMATYPWVTLDCLGEAVGLPPGQMGNSEVGHLNIGAGRVVHQDIVRITQAAADGSLAQNPTLVQLCERVRSGSGRLHLIGLVSTGGVHSHQGHLEALIDLALDKGVDQVLIHAILDGRDTPPQSGADYLRRLQGFVQDRPGCQIASVSGRYYSMDRDKRWERTAKAYQALVQGQGPGCQDSLTCVQDSYARDIGDEFVSPQVVVDQGGQPRGAIKDGDGVFFFNFRADRARQLVKALTSDEFDHFERGLLPKLSGLATMTEYDPDLGLPVAFAPQRLEDILGEVVSRSGLRQLRIAETEKYAHVTYFFNGGEEQPFANEDRLLVPSPQDVPTYDYRPEMSVIELTERLINRWASQEYALVVANFANLDMVGHTGDFQAAVQAAEAVDACVGKVVKQVLGTGGRLLLTADHGNADVMLDTDGNPYTAHSLNPVPFVCIQDRPCRLRSGGVLGDIAPTILDLWGQPIPKAMTGRSLVQGQDQ